MITPDMNAFMIWFQDYFETHGGYKSLMDPYVIAKQAWLDAIHSEREAYAKIAEKYSPTDADGVCPLAQAIRRRNNQRS